jgi:predicted secreted protein
MKEQGQGRPEGAPKEEDRTPQKEQGRTQKESKEGQALPNVWDVLKRKARASDEFLNLLSKQQQIQQWRSHVEPLSDEDIAECARKQKEEIEAFQRGEIPILSFHPTAGDGELILAEHIAKKGKKG